MRTETIKRFADHIQTSEEPLAKRVLNFRATRREFIELVIAVGSHAGEIFRRQEAKQPSRSLFSDAVSLITDPPETSTVGRLAETAVETAVVYKSVEKMAKKIQIPFTPSAKSEYLGPLTLSSWSADQINKYAMAPVIEEGLFNSAPHLLNELVLKRIEDPTVRSGAGILLGLTSSYFFATGHKRHMEIISDGTGSHRYAVPNTVFPIETMGDMIYRYNLNTAKGPLHSILSHSLTNIFVGIDNGIRPTE